MSEEHFSSEPPERGRFKDAGMGPSSSKRSSRADGNLNRIWLDRLALYMKLGRTNPVSCFASGLLECANDFFRGKLSPASVVALLGVMSALRVTNERLLDEISRFSKRHSNGFRERWRAKQARAYANLLRGNDPILEEHRTVCLAERNWELNSLVLFLWAFVVAEKDVPQLFGADALRRLCPNGVRSFNRFRELEHLRLLCELDLPGGLTIRPANGNHQQHQEDRSLSPLEQVLATALRTLGLSFRQQVPIGGFVCDFVVELNRSRVVIEGMGLSYHFLRELPLGEKGEVRLGCTGKLRGEDRLRCRIFRKLGYPVLIVRSDELPQDASQHPEFLEARLKGV